MGFEDLDTEAVFAKLQMPETDGVPEAQPVQEPSTVSESVQTQSDATPPKETSQAPTKEDVRIPKARLDHEIAQRKSVQNELAKAQAELDSLRKSAQGTTDRNQLARDMGEADDLEAKITKLESWRQELEWNTQVQESRKELDATVGSIKKEFPDVPDKVLYSAVIQNPKVDLWHVAEQYDKWEQEVVARRGGQQTNTPARPAPVPRPMGTSTPQAGHPSTSGQNAPTSMAEAMERTLALFGN